MGQGFSLTTLSAGSANIDVPELADLRYEKSLGAARFMKSVRARHKDGLVVARVVMKPYAQFNLDRYAGRLIEERRLLADVPNALGYHRILETAIGGYLVRQYVHSSLYDRLSTRPFLEEIEKKWLSFQLLCAVRDCHAKGIYHGDIKTENVLVTSWNWAYLTDFSASYKPAYLPEDNPADFSFYFDMSGRRTCYLAPERFLGPGAQPEGEGTITWAMDIFSVGCVIAELFLESPIFNLSQLYKYRTREYDPVQLHLSKIKDKDVRELITHMIQIDPNSRMSAEDYLEHWQGKVFPHYFSGFLHQYMHSTITDPSSGRKPVTTAAEHLGEPDDRIEQIYNDFDKISHLLSSKDGNFTEKPQHSPPKLDGRLFPLCIDIPNYQHQASPTPSLAVDDGNLIFLTIVVSSLRGTARASARLLGLELLLAFAERLTDEAKLDRVVPYVATLLTDKSVQVKVAALRTMTQILDMVHVVSPVNAYVFPEYVLPRLERYLPDSAVAVDPLVRRQYAWCIGTLATTAARYLDVIQALRAEGTLPAAVPEAEEDLTASVHRNQFDSDRQNLLEAFEKHTKSLLIDSDPFVRRAMLRSVGDLCVFFGSPRANDVVLSHLNTYLNDPDWMLKCAFFQAIVGVAVFVGSASLEALILPLMIQALTDPEEFVVENVVRALSAIAEQGLFQRSKAWELVDIVARLTMHPNIWIREAAAQFIASAAKCLSDADNHSILINLIRPYLKIIPSEFTELRLLNSLKKPLPRLIMEMASNWVTQSQKGLFWVPAQKQQAFSFSSSDDTLPTISGRELDAKVLQRMQKTEEDEQWIRKLRNAGLTAEDDFKLVALREFIWRVTRRRRSDGLISTPSKFNSMVSLKDLDIRPRTVLFENAQQTVQEARRMSIQDDGYQPKTIRDALLDASTTETEMQAARRTARGSIQADRPAHGQRPRRISIPSRPKFGSSPSGMRSGTNSPASDVTVHGRESLQVPRSGSPSVLSPTGSFGAGDHVHPLRHRGSALALLSRGDKAQAEIGTTSANAAGKVDGAAHVREISRARHRPSSLTGEHRRGSTSRTRLRDAHNYTGNDPAVLKLLDSMLLERFPSGITEFGPKIEVSSEPSLIRYKDGHQSLHGLPWRPEGRLLEVLGEHTAAVRRILVAPDQTFFITSSDDGTVKIWDPSRFERHLSLGARQTYSLGDGVSVTSLCFVEHTYCFVATGSDGSVHVVRVKFREDKEEDNNGDIVVTRKFSRPSLLREYQLPGDDYATSSDHFNDDNNSVLVMATRTSNVIALDLKTMTEMYTLKSPLHHGYPTSFCIDKKAHWLLLGTSHGVLELWDLRFRLQLKSWAFHAAATIHRVYLRKIGKPRVYITGGTGQGEVTVWDIEKTICKEVYRTGTAKDIGSKTTTLIDLDLEAQGGMLDRFSTLEPTTNSGPDKGVRAVVVAAQTITQKPGGKTHIFLLTAGPDWKVRYWDTTRQEASVVVSGMEPDEARPQYTTSQPPSSPETLVVTERLHQLQSQSQSTASRDGRSTTKKSVGKISRTGLISAQQQHLLKGHLDTILDVALVESPYGMVISADRSGRIYVFA
ncbi:phosphoinositide 3-kinase regulatory subunit 4 [Bimuria novae-zelandiae CBS 107.79]|uniref:non-specific serine/threonine protein kinase n=1 Tax=Bimuria novae-zelandiae CBS 107.79 TaxID=1447943 RepID=A0A6A5UMG2_9PLEO|nr:phosphoinositide 3-kinase regulatory subunit 4 [Bimuria novae-zelandiae CBS 107.79]